ncbi:hypothetical protein HJC23_010509 [Cyclotella cryptica]|uniref:Uncharacterized protein n=1 Tax=Cyclotella cryptica TaxID=29204 RepID=A0ABD3QB91_9STRA|eukprot:CCRYP_007085-RA/>CCRYP_007085-RA protein AED:0.40 eAED:0.40 QI:0/-1/0/1/-1/1/1/0/391
MSGTPSKEEGKPQKVVQRGKGKALNALAAASGRDPALIAAAAEASAKANAKAAAAKQEEERAKRLAEEQRAKERATPRGIYDSLSSEERYRFECFRRCGFPSRPVEEFVAGAMVEEARRRYLVLRGVVAGLGVPSNGGSGDASGLTDGEHESTDTSGGTGASSSLEEHSDQNAKQRRKRTKKSYLNEESKRRRDAMDQPFPYLIGTSSQGATGTQQRVPRLEDLVAPESASEIVVVVSTLAKCYAQRLVAAARRVADAEDEAANLDSAESEEQSCQNEEDNDLQASVSQTGTKPIKPLQPHHYMDAYRHRVNAGIDPGFWMNDMICKGSRERQSDRKGAGVTEAAAVGRRNWKSAHLAALAAQDAYDEMVREESNKVHNPDLQSMDIEDGK